MPGSRVKNIILSYNKQGHLWFKKVLPNINCQKSWLENLSVFIMTLIEIITFPKAGVSQLIDHY